MKTIDRKTRRDRALQIFERESREQDLHAIALRQTPETLPVMSSDGSAAGTHLAALDRASEAMILATHTRLLAARSHAARLAAADEEIARLDALIDGAFTETGATPGSRGDDVIDAEVMAVRETAETPPTATPTATPDDGGLGSPAKPDPLNR